MFQSRDYLKSKGITHVINLGQLDPFGVAPNIDPDSLPGNVINMFTDSTKSQIMCAEWQKMRV